jgi:chromosome segregation ATPase
MAVITDKDAEIARLNREIEEEERLLDEMHQNQMDEDARKASEIVNMEAELKYLEEKSRLVLESLHAQQDHEITERKQRHEQELGELREELARVSKENFPARLNGDLQSDRRGLADSPELCAARKRARTSAEQVTLLEARLHEFATEQQNRQSYGHRTERKRAKRIQEADSLTRHEERVDLELEMQELKDIFQKEFDALNKKLEEQLEKNRQLEAQIAAVKEQINEMNRRLRRVKETKAKSSHLAKSHVESFFVDHSAIDTEIIRLRDENEDLLGILKKLDHLVYDANAK